MSVEFVDSYGVNVFLPKDWRLFYVDEPPAGLIVSPDEKVVVVFAPLEKRFVELGLRGMVRTFLRLVMGVKTEDAVVLYNREGKLVRHFGLVLDGGKYYVFGVLSLDRLDGALGSYYEYFVRFVFSRREDVAREYLWVLDKIFRAEVGTPVDPAFVEYVFPGRGAVELWSVRVPVTMVVVPRNYGFRGFLGGIIYDFDAKPFLVGSDDSIRGAALELAREILGDGIEFFAAGAEGDWLYYRALKGHMVGDIRVLKTRFSSNPDFMLAKFYSVFYLKHNRYSAVKVMARMMATWRLTVKALNDLIPPYTPPVTGTFDVPVSSVSTPITISSPSGLGTPKKPSVTARSNRSNDKRDLEECKRRKRRLKWEIDDIRTKLRLLDHDYNNMLTVYDSVKTGELITGFYTFTNPVGKTRFIHTKIRSPVVGDRFWEPREKAYLENRTFFVTRNFAPWNKHDLVELKWSVQEKLKKLESEYRRKRRELEDKLRRLEQELRSLPC